MNHRRPSISGLIVALAILVGIAVLCAFRAIIYIAGIGAADDPQIISQDRTASSTLFAVSATAMVIALALTIRFLIQRHHWFVQYRRRVFNQCIFCGYDLHSTPNRCPECGKMVEKF
jgi:hypothetical protein